MDFVSALVWLCIILTVSTNLLVAVVAWYITRRSQALLQAAILQTQALIRDPETIRIVSQGVIAELVKPENSKVLAGAILDAMAPVLREHGKDTAAAVCSLTDHVAESLKHVIDGKVGSYEKKYKQAGSGDAGMAVINRLTGKNASPLEKLMGATMVLAQSSGKAAVEAATAPAAVTE